MHPAEATTVVEHSSSEPSNNSWFWDYASQRAPDHNEMYYFQFTLLSVTFFFVQHLLVHLCAKRVSPVYADMTVKK